MNVQDFISMRKVRTAVLVVKGHDHRRTACTHLRGKKVTGQASSIPVRWRIGEDLERSGSWDRPLHQSRRRSWRSRSSSRRRRHSGNRPLRPGGGQVSTGSLFPCVSRFSRSQQAGKQQVGTRVIHDARFDATELLMMTDRDPGPKLCVVDDVGL